MSEEKQTSTEHSGKLILRMPKQLHADLAREADAQGVSLNQYLVYLLAERRGKKRKKAGT